MSGSFFSYPWMNAGTINAVAAAADGALAVNERRLSFVKDLTNVVVCKLPQGINSIEARFLCVSDGDNHVIDVWAGKSGTIGGVGNTDLCRICTLTVQTGLQVATDKALLYADEILITNEDWMKEIEAIQSGNDSDFMARLHITDICGYDVLVFHGHSIFPNNIQIEISGFSSYFDSPKALP